MSTHYPSRAERFISGRLADGFFAGGVTNAVLVVVTYVIYASVDDFGAIAAYVFVADVVLTVVSVFLATIRWSPRDRP